MSRTEIFYCMWTKGGLGCWPVTRPDTMPRAARVSGGSAGSGHGSRSDRKNVHNDFAVDGRLDIEQDAFQVRGLRIKQITEVLHPRVV